MRQLQVEPELRAHLEVARQPQSSVGSHRAPAVHNLSDAGCGNTDIHGQPVLADAHRLEELFGQDLPGMCGYTLQVPAYGWSVDSHFLFPLHGCPLWVCLVVIHDLYIACAVVPYEADAILIVDADAVLSFPITMQRFQSVARRHTQVGKLLRSVNLI
jgi:hypothetical protein